MNEALTEILEILKYILPSVVVFATAYYLLSQFLNDRQKLEVMRQRAERTAGLIPARLQAYERLILLLERLEPSSLMMRVHRPNVNAAMFKQDLMRTIREEYEHNLSQQLYVSKECWDMVLQSKNAVTQVIELAGKGMNEKSTGLDLSNMILTIVSQAGVSPSAAGIEALKKEARQLL